MNKSVYSSLFASVVFLALYGCNHTPTNQSTGQLKEASTITYNLPVTSAKIQLTLTLQECGAVPKAKAVVSVLPVASPSPFPEHQFTVSGSDLRSFTKKRDVTISLHPHGAIKTVNASVEDKTAGIIGSAVKLVSLFLDADDNAKTLETCNQETIDALEARSDLKKKIVGVRKLIRDPGNKESDKLIKRVDALTRELARLETAPLQLKLSKSVGFKKDTKTGVITWTGKELEKWFSNISSKAVNNFKVAFCIAEVSDQGSDSCIAGEIVAPPQGATATEPKPAGVSCQENGGDCSKTLVFREPVPARLTIIAIGADLTVDPDTVLAQSKLLVAQWGTISYLPLTVGFGGNKSISLSLDEYGRRTTFGWNSGASGEGAISGLLGIGEAVVAAKSASDSEEVQAMKDEVAELETRQKLNKLENCRSILENGGFVCPDE